MSNVRFICTSCVRLDKRDVKPAAIEHPCPLKAVENQDDETKCDCCEECELICVRQI